MAFGLAELAAAVALGYGGSPATVDFGAVQLGDAAHRLLPVQALSVVASGPGYSAAVANGGVLIVFEPYELDEEVSGALRLKTRSGIVRIALRGHGIDTIRPSVEVETPRDAVAGRPLTIRFAATDNDLILRCTFFVRGRMIGRVVWPASSYRWHVPRTLRGRVRIAVVAVDRAGNRVSVSSGAFAVRRR
jgi:hypothetical protein